MMKPESFEQATELFIVPLGILVLSWLIQRQHDARLNAGSDLFVLIASLDLMYLAKGAAAVPRINPDFSRYCGPLFVCSLVLSLILLSYAAIVQGVIQKHLTGEVKYYPGIRVFEAWVFALASIDFHVIVL